MANQWDRGAGGGLDRAQAEARLAAARATGDRSAEADALVSLVEVTYRLWDPPALVRYAARAWELAEGDGLWDHLRRLALLFGAIAFRAGDYRQGIDHYANACAYAGMVDPAVLRATTTRLDELALALLADGRSAIAAALCEVLVEYEAAGGLGRPDPVFAAHFRDLRGRITPGAWAAPSRAAA